MRPVTRPAGNPGSGPGAGRPVRSVGRGTLGLGLGIDDDGYGMGGLGGNYGGISTVGGYTAVFVTGSVRDYDRIDALDNTLRHCLGLPPLPGTGDPSPPA